jgi:hypothetical protein
MKFFRMIATGLAALTASLSSSGSVNACDQCRSRTACQACARADDRGLLDSLSEAAQRMQPRLPRWTAPRLPSLDVALRQALGGRFASLGCASCGCELNGPSCGCELREPTCRCELREPTCGCELAPNSGYHKHPSDKTAPAPHQYLHDAAPLPVPVPRQVAPQTPPPYVVPQPIPQPLPPKDSEVDPFRDDSASRLRRIPTRTIQYRETTPASRPTFDPQASQSGAQQRVSDSPHSTTQHMAFDEQSSSRSRSSAPAPITSWGSVETNAEAQPEVVTASAVTPRRLIQSVAPLKPHSNHTPDLPNPLRSR